MLEIFKKEIISLQQFNQMVTDTLERPDDSITREVPFWKRKKKKKYPGRERDPGSTLLQPPASEL